MSDSSWPPRVRESHEPDRPRTPLPEDEPAAPPPPDAPEAAAPLSPESIGAVDHGETRVRRRGLRRRNDGIEERAGDPDRSEGDRWDDDDRDDDDDGDRRRLVAGLLIGGLVLMTALAATFFALWLANAETEADDVRSYFDDERPQIEERARTAVDILINYDSANIDERRTEMLEVSTGGFRDDYEEFTDTLGSVLKEAGASSRGAILAEPRISFTSPEEADVVVRTEQIAQTRENPSGRTIEYIMRLGLIDTQGGWKVDSIEILSDEVT